VYKPSFEKTVFLYILDGYAQYAGFRSMEYDAMNHARLALRYSAFCCSGTYARASFTTPANVFCLLRFAVVDLYSVPPLGLVDACVPSATSPLSAAVFCRSVGDIRTGRPGILVPRRMPILGSRREEGGGRYTENRTRVRRLGIRHVLMMLAFHADAVVFWDAYRRCPT